VASLALSLLGTDAMAREAEDRSTRARPVVGTASWYGPGFHGRKTASGDRFDQEALTAAHRNLPLGSVVRVTNLENGRKVTVEINDRGPYIRGRVIDLSRGAAQKLGMVQDGVAQVRVEVLSRPDDFDNAERVVVDDDASVPTF
jgi:rare lipoprotein A